MRDIPKKDGADYAANGVQIRFIGALAVIGMLILISQIALQWSLSGQQQAAHIVNVASQQRTLSQTLIKNGYRLIGVGSTEARRAAYEEMSDALARLQRAHAGLQHGSEELNLPGNNDVTTVGLFATVEPEFQSIIDSAHTVLSAAERPGELHQAVQRLTQHEADFLHAMNPVISHYESLSAQRIGYARWLGLAFGLLTLAALVLATRKVFQPVVAEVQKNLQRHEDIEAEMEKIFSGNPAALFLIDTASMAIERGNLKAEILMGCSSDEFIGRPLSTYFDTRLEANQKFLHQLRTGEIFDEIMVLLLDGRHQAVDALASMRQVTYSGKNSYLIALTDVTGAHKK